MKKVLSIFSLIILCAATCIAQTESDRVKEELDKRGLRDDEVRQRLLERGFDIDNIDINNPSAVFQLEKNLQEVLDEMEKEKLTDEQKGSTITDKELTQEESKILAKEGEDISEAIDEGATLEEAVSEELIDAQETSLPKAQTYGQEVFRSQNIKLYRKSEDVKPPNSYILGAGDIITVSIWGYSEEDLIFEINDEGYIKPQGIPRIYLKGIRLSQAKSLLSDRFSNYYKFNANEFEVGLSFGRTINVNITGEVFNYGNFNLPAINTAFNALVAAGGPNDIGSVRNITLKRFGEPDKDIDIYKYLQNPSYEMDFFLEEEDIIHVPVAEKLVTIDGAVIRPNQYELKSSEDLVELLQFCGGLKANASLKNIQIKRFIDDQEKIIDVNLNEVVKRNTDFTLKNGDEILVFEIPNKFKNFASVEGAVDLPGKYAIEKNTRISDLLDKTYLKEHAYLEIAYLKRPNRDQTTFSYFRIAIGQLLENNNHPDNILVENGDELVIYSKSRFKDAEDFSVSGHVREAGSFEYDFSNTLKLSDAIILAGGTKKFPTDFAYIQRASIKEPGKIKYLRVNLSSAILNPSGPENVAILPGDKIVIYAKEDLIENEEITVRGLVRNPGVYKFDPSLKIKDLIDMSGGLSVNASRKRIDVFRLEVSDDKETQTLAANLILDKNNNIINGAYIPQPRDIIVFRNAAEFEDIRTVEILGEIAYPGYYAIIEENERISSIIKRAGGLTDEAFIPGMVVNRFAGDIGIISLNADEKIFDNSDQNIVVKNNDVIVVPKTNDLVTISGTTNTGQQIVVPFVRNKTALQYVEDFSGGINDKIGDKRRILVRYPDGHYKTPKRRFLFSWKYPSIEPGCRIEVPSKIVEQNSNKEKKDWGNILEKTVTQATALLTLIVLIQRID